MFTTLSIFSLYQGNLHPQTKTSRSSQQSDIDAAMARHAAAQDPAGRPHASGEWITSLTGKIGSALQRSAQRLQSVRLIS